MRLRSAMLALLLAVACSACGADEQTSGSESATRPQQASESLAPQGPARQAAPPTLARTDDSGFTTASSREGDAAAGREEAAAAETSNEKEVVQESGPTSRDEDAGSAQADIGEAGMAAEEPPRDLTDLPTRVVRDAEVRVRPGLPWRVVERLTAGEPVLVRQRARGWLRIHYGDDSEGWIRGAAVDLGEIEEYELRGQPAPPITAEWQGVEYGVMGQSADAAAVRLLRRDDERSEIVSAPMGEVTLLVEDITVEDLPVLVGEETVVFTGDDFRAGQGRILPKASEWMWLPEGSLLAHNDEYIWQWHPETNELEFVHRPLGFARLSPGGESLAILTCGGEEPCRRYLDATILALDGAPKVRLQDQAGVNRRLGGLKAIDIVWSDEFMWTSDGRGLLIPLVPETGVYASAAALLHADRQAVIFDLWGTSSSLREDCSPAPNPRGLGWGLSSDDLVTFSVTCADKGRAATWHVATYDAKGLSIAVGPALTFTQPALGEESPLSTALGELSDDAFWLRGGTMRHAIVVDPALRTLFLHDKADGRTREIVDGGNLVPDWLWELIDLGPGYGYRHWDLYWSADRHVAVIARTGFTHITAAFLIDLTTANAVSLPIGAVRTWPCFPTGGWSPDGAVFQVEFHDYASEAWLDRRWIDGVALMGSKPYQRQFVNSEGQVIGVLRATAFRGANFPPHVAQWSPDGRFFAVGGHQNLHHCYGW